MSDETGAREELTRIRRVADMLCTAHSELRDRFASRAFWLDLLILLASAWLTACAFMGADAAEIFTPRGWKFEHWVGLLGVIVFGLTLVQIRTDWKAKADAHRRSFELYAEVKREAGYILAGPHVVEDAYKRLLSRYDMASAVAVAVPESDFLHFKSRHLMKVAISKHLDAKPAASILVYRLNRWFADTFRD